MRLRQDVARIGALAARGSIAGAAPPVAENAAAIAQASDKKAALAAVSDVAAGNITVDGDALSETLAAIKGRLDTLENPPE